MNRFLTKQDDQLHTGKTYCHNFQWYAFDEENCMFYVWHKKEIKLIESKNLWSTMNVFFVKDEGLQMENLDNAEKWILAACGIFSAFDEDSGWFYSFLPYFPTKLVEEKNAIFSKLWLDVQISNSSKWVLINSNKVDVKDLDIEWKIGFLFWLTILYWKFENKGDKLLAIKIQLPLFGQFLSVGDDLVNIQKELQDRWVFIQISENVQWDKCTYEVTSNDYELLEIFSQLYLSVENFSQITKREQAQEAIEALKVFLKNEWDMEAVKVVENSCVKLLQKI